MARHLAALAAAFYLAIFGPTQAQQASDVREELFRDWKLICFTAEETTAGGANRSVRRCRINHEIRAGEQDKALVAVMSLRLVGEQRRPLLVLRLPPAAAAGDSVALAIDSERGVQIENTDCDEQRCKIQVIVPNRFANQMKFGLNLNVVFNASEEQRVRIQGSLRGFTRAFEALTRTGL